MTKSKPPKLPDTPSALIRLALLDLEKCEKSKRYEVNMGEWHTPNGVCKVCLAGSVMAQTMHCSPQKLLVPNSEFFDRDTYTKLSALNEFRTGSIEFGFYDIGIDKPDSIPNDMDVADYHLGPTRFKRDMRKLATMLAKEGL